MNIQEIRSQYPMYSDLSDQELADGFHSKYYSDIPKTDFYTKLGIKQEDSFLSQVGKSIVGGVGAAADFIAPANLAVPGLIEGARTLVPESLGGISTEQAAQNITSGNIPGTQISYAALQPSTMARGILGIDLETGQREQEQANIPLHALSKGADIVGSFVNEKTDSPLLATAANLGVATAGLMGAHKAAVKGTEITAKGIEKFRKQPTIDPKLDAVLSESELLKFKEQQKKQNAIPLEYDPGFAEGNVSRESAPLEMPAIEFPLDVKTPTSLLYDAKNKQLTTKEAATNLKNNLFKKKKELTTEQEFYDLLKAEEAKLPPDVDTSEVFNPFFKGDRNANVEVDSVSGRPIFPEETIVDNTLTKPNGEPQQGYHTEGQPFVTINPDAIARFWLRLTPEKKAEMGLRSAEDLQNFVEMHERGHKFDSLEAGGHGRPGETKRDVEARVNRGARDNLSTFPKEEVPTEGFQPAATRTEYSDRFTTDLQSGKFNDPVARQKEIVAKRKRLEKVDERVRTALEASLRNPKDIVSMKTYEEALDLKNRMEAELEALDKLGKGLEKNKRSSDFPEEIEFQKPVLPKVSAGKWFPRKNSQAGPGGKQGGAVNFGFAQAIVDRFKKDKENIPSLKTVADHIQRDVDDPVVAQLYKKYYGKEVKSLTPEEAAVARIPGLSKTVSPELQSVETMIDRWKTESDVSGNPVRTALSENFSSGRQTAARTNNSYIDWNVENILNTTKKAQVIIKEEQSAVIKEYAKIAKTPLLKKLSGEKKSSAFVKAMSELIRVQDKNEIPNIAPEAKPFADALTKALEKVGRLVEAEFKSQGIPFKWRTNYLAHSFVGAFRVLARDASGEVIGVISGKTAAERAKAMEYVKEKMPDVQFSTPEYNKSFDNAGTQYGKRYAIGSEIMNSLEEGSPVAAQLKDTLSEFYAEPVKDYYGYTQHSKKMKGVFGYEGGKMWKSIEENALDALEAQLSVIDYAHHWLAEQKLRKDMKVIEDSGVNVNLPEASAYVNLYLDHAFGRLTDQAALVDTTINWAAKTLGISGASAKEALAIARNFALVNSLSSVGNVIANLTQSLTHPQIAIAKAFGEGIRGDVALAQAVGWTDATHVLSGHFEKLSPDGAFFYKYSKEVGSGDPHLIEHTISRKVIPTTGASPIRRAIAETVNTVFKAAQIESDFLGKYMLEYPEKGTRTTFLFSMAHYYKSAGFSAKEAIIQADKDLSNIFTDYSSQERAMMFQRLGEIGKFSGTVNTYKFNSYNQIATQVGRGNVPAIAMIGLVLYATGGLLGLPGADELEFGINFARSKGWYPEGMMSYKEWMLTKADVLATGPLAELTGLNGKPKMALQRKFTNENIIPDTIPDFVYPLHSFFTKKVTTTSDAAKQPTKETVGVATREWVPGNLKVLIDKLLLTDPVTGRTVGSTSLSKDNQSGFKFTSDEWKSKMILGVPTMKEFKANQLANLDRIAQEARKTRSDSLIDATLKAFQNKDVESTRRLYQQAVKFNQNTSEVISKKITERAISRNEDPDVYLGMKLAGKATSLHGVNRLQQFQKMQGNK